MLRRNSGLALNSLRRIKAWACLCYTSNFKLLLVGGRNFPSYYSWDVLFVPEGLGESLVSIPILLFQDTVVGL